MNRRALLVPAIAFLSGLLALCLAVLWTLWPQPEGQRASSVGGPFTLTSMTGQRVSDRDLQGAPLLVFFGFTHCPDICPTKLMELSEVFRAAGDKAGKARAAFITVDPARDTPEIMKSYLASFDDRIIGLTGSQDEIDAVVKAYRAYARRVPTSGGDYTMDHTALVYLMDRRGQFIGAFNLERPPAEAARELLRHM
jgi:protein SCO1/2